MRVRWRGVVSVLLSVTMALGLVPAPAMAEAAEEAGEVASTLQAQAALPEVASRVADEIREELGDQGEEQLVRELYRRLASVEVEAESDEEPNEEQGALDVLEGRPSTRVGIAQAFVFVARELGIEVQEARGADGSTWCVVKVGDAWLHVDPASAADAEDESWLLLDDSAMSSKSSERMPWERLDDDGVVADAGAEAGNEGDATEQNPDSGSSDLEKTNGESDGQAADVLLANQGNDFSCDDTQESVEDVEQRNVDSEAACSASTEEVPESRVCVASSDLIDISDRYSVFGQPHISPQLYTGTRLRQH